MADALPALAALLTQHGARLPDGRDITAAHLRVSIKRPGMPALAAVASTKLDPFDFESRKYSLQVVVRVIVVLSVCVCVCNLPDLLPLSVFRSWKARWRRLRL